MAGSLDKSGLSPQEIYEKLTGGPGLWSLEDAGSTTRKEWAKEDDRAQLIRQLGEHIRRGWQGAASDAAFGAAKPLAEAAAQGADRLDTAQDLLNRQGGSFHRAYNDVRPVPPRPPDNPIIDMIPFETDLDRQVKAYQADAQHNIQVFEGYDNASLYNETNMPTILERQQFRRHHLGEVPGRWGHRRRHRRWWAGQLARWWRARQRWARQHGRAR